METTKTPAGMSRGRAMLYILICALMWSTGGVLVKMIEANALVISCLRSLIALPVFLLFYPPRTLRFTIKVWLIAFLLAFTGIGFVIACKLTTAANAIVLQYISPVFIVLINRVVYKERVARADVIACLGCILGMALFFFDELSPGNLLGNLVAILSGLTNAGLFVAMNRTEEDRGTINIAAQIESVVLCLPFLFLYPPAFTAKMVVSLLVLGIFQRAFSMLLYVRSSPHCSAMDAILIAMAEPLANPLLVMIFYREMPGRFALFGGMIVIASVLLWNIIKIKSTQAPSGGA